MDQTNRDSGPDPAFATDAATADYYDRRAPEYDEWYAGTGMFSDRDRPGWHDEIRLLVDTLHGLPPARTLDLACGTGFLSEYLRGPVFALDRSPAMAGLARPRVSGPVMVGDALHVGLATAAFDQVFTAHFYGHLSPGERAAFLAEAARLAPHLLVVDSARRSGVDAEQWQERVLNDGSRHRVFKRYLDPDQLAGEIGGRVLFTGDWFVAART
ncbi:MAG: methyltransferase domain-containing protein [Actinomycetota bacterium]|nr:methyltransferase domain-containing protein [Actinomycetota bacterium]